MARRGRVVEDMASLVALFAPRCEERETLSELGAMLDDASRWPRAHDLFQRMRAKTLVAERDQNRRLAAQYLFEEVCAQTLYNLSGGPAPFDADAPYWIAPNAFALARALGLDEVAVQAIVGR